MKDEPKLKRCSFFLLRYAPDLRRDEALNLGVFLHSPEEKYLGCVLTDDFRRVKRLHPQADLELLRALQQHFDEEIDRRGDDLEAYIGEMQESYSNLIQVSDPRPCLLADPQGEIQSLFARYVGAPSIGPGLDDTRLRIKQRLTAALVRAGTWDRIEKRIPAAQWTRKGDPFVFDYGYRLITNGASLDAPSPRSRIKLIHALSLKRDSTLATALAFTMKQVRAREPADLTMVVEARAEAGAPAARYTESLLEENGIAIQPLASIDDFGQSVRQDLRL
jgi:DUF3037 family protein